MRLVAFVVSLVMVGSPAWADDEEGGGGDEPTPTEPAPAEPAGGGDDDKPDEPAPAAAADDDAGSADDAAQPAAAGGDDDGKPDDAAKTDDDDVHAAKPGDADGDGTPDAAEDSDGDGTPDGKEDSDGDGVSDADEMAAYADVDINAADSDGDGTPDAQEDGDIDNDGIPDAEEEDPPTDPFDADGDGVLEPEEIEDRKEFAEFFDDIPNSPDAAALDARPEDKELAPSISLEDFRKGVRIVKKIVLGKMAKKMAAKADKRMRTFSLIVMGVSLLGFGLLLMPLALKKKYPGQGATLFKYSALAAGTFIVTVNLFGGVLFGMRTVQGALSEYTNPSVAIAAGTFDTLDENAEHYLVTGKELFLPVIEQMRNQPDELPLAVLLENGTRVVKDAKVFLTIKNMVQKVDWLFSMLPIVLTLVTLILFVLAIKPTLVEIIKLPAAAAAGNTDAGKDVVKRSIARVKGELLASVCTVGVLIVLTMLSAFVLARIVGPAIFAMLDYFSLTVSYLLFQEGASSGLVFVTLFAVIVFLVLNLAALILSMSFFLGKAQKIFQQRFNEATPLSEHKRFFQWGAPSVVLVQLFPWLFAMFSMKVLDAVNESVVGDATNAEAVSWTKLLLAGPVVLVVAFAVLFWAVRGLKAIKFLAGYKVKKKPA